VAPEKLEDPPGVSLDVVADGAYDDPECVPDGWADPEEPEEPEDSGDDEADCDEV